MGLAPGHRRGDSRSEPSKGRSAVHSGLISVRHAPGHPLVLPILPTDRTATWARQPNPGRRPPNLCSPLALLKGTEAPGTQPAFKNKRVCAGTHSRKEGRRARDLPRRSTGIGHRVLPPPFPTTGQSKFSGIFLVTTGLQCLSQAETAGWRLGGGQPGEKLGLTLGGASWCQGSLSPDTALWLPVSFNQVPTLPVNSSFV